MLKTTFKKSPAPSSVGGNNSTYEPDPELYKIASGMVFGSVIKRRNEQSVNWYMLALGLFGLVYLPYWWFSSIIKKSEMATIRREERLAEYNNIVQNDGMTHIAIDGAIPSVNDVIAMPTIGARPIPNEPVGIISTPAAIITPSPTPPVSPAPTSELLLFGYSYYFPDLGGTNCHPANWDGASCANTTASGAGWREYIGRGVAIHQSMIEKYPYGTIFRVLSPQSIAGDYTVIDLCAGCIRPDAPDMMWIDFLDDSQKLNWSVPVLIEVVR